MDSLNIKTHEYEEAKKKVKELKGFYYHAMVYVLVNILLISINLIQTPDILWFYFTTIGWGIGLAFHWFGVSNVNILGRGWEDKKIAKILDKEEKETEPSDNPV